MLQIALVVAFTWLLLRIIHISFQQLIRRFPCYRLQMGQIFPVICIFMWFLAIASPYTFLKNPISVTVESRYDYDFLLRLVIKAYVVDVRLEHLLASDITERFVEALHNRCPSVRACSCPTSPPSTKSFSCPSPVSATRLN
jgi:hypothetical protein